MDFRVSLQFIYFMLEIRSVFDGALARIIGKKTEVAIESSVYPANP